MNDFSKLPDLGIKDYFTIENMLIVLSAAFRTLAEIAKWRRDWSWIPVEFFTYRGPLNIDPYHFASNLHWTCLVVAVWIYRNKTDNPKYPGIFYYVFLWVVHGIINDLFYHVIWMKPEYWFK